MIGAQGPDRSGLPFAAEPDGLSPPTPGELDQGGADAAGRPRHQHPVLRPYLGAVQHVLRGHAGSGEGRQFGIREIAVDHMDVPYVGNRVVGEAAVAFGAEVAAFLTVERVVPVAQPAIHQHTPAQERGVASRAQGDHAPADVRALNTRKGNCLAAPACVRVAGIIRRLTGGGIGDASRVPRRTGIDVGVVEPAGVHRDKQLTGLRTGPRPVLVETEPVKSAMAGQHHGAHDVGQGRLSPG